MKRKLPSLFPLLVCFLFGLRVTLWATPSSVSTDTLTQPKVVKTDSSARLVDILRRGQFFGHARAYAMGTTNRGDLQDYYALALGAGIGYRTARIAGHIELGMSGFFIFNPLSSDLGKVDPLTGNGSRYEVALFDVRNPSNKEDLDRLEELYVRYHFGRSSQITAGRQIPASPFVNPQDGRMCPTLTEGIVLEWNELKNTRVRAEYLTRVSPRSTVEWFGIGESMGVLPGGLATDGQPSRYLGNTKADQLIILGLTQQISRLKVDLWETAVPGVFHTAYGQAEWHQPIRPGVKWWLGGQVSRQWGLGNGGNENPHLAYTDPNHRATVFSGRAGLQVKRWTWLLNATRTTAEGRFLMPREWGREPFYTFMFRERNEGIGDMKAITASIQYSLSDHWRWEFTAGSYQLPAVTNTEFNKYSLPSYAHVTVRSIYRATGFLKGLNTEFLFVHKSNQSGSEVTDKVAQNRVGVNHLDIIFNYYF